MAENNRLIKIVVTGPESTGKTTLSELLAPRLKAMLIPEYARTYIEQLQRPYTREDVEHIARIQIGQDEILEKTPGSRMVLLDTWLIITKVWMDLLYGSSPDWIDNHLRNSEIDFFLVCKPDLPWIDDPVRENGGEMRNTLFGKYCHEIESYGFRYGIVQGTGRKRVENAMKLLHTHHIC